MSDNGNRARLHIADSTRLLEILLTPAGVCSSVKLDGEEVKNCRAVSFRAAVGEATTVSLEIINVAVLVEGGVIGKDVKVVDVTPLDADQRRYALARMEGVEDEEDEDGTVN